MLVLSHLLFALIFAQTNPNLFDHEHRGCPENSTCSKQMGLFYEQWTKATGQNSRQLNQFLAKQGMPFPLWSRPPIKHLKEWLIEWDSPCAHHRPDDASKRIHIALVKIKHLRELDRHREYLPRDIIKEVSIDRATKRYRTQVYRGLRDELPSYFDGDHLVYEQYHEGHYFTLKVHAQGKLSFGNKGPHQRSQAMTCPPHLIAAFNKRPHVRALYQHYDCRKLWNKKTKKWEQVIYGKACD